MARGSESRDGAATSVFGIAGMSAGDDDLALPVRLRRAAGILCDSLDGECARNDSGGSQHLSTVHVYVSYGRLASVSIDGNGLVMGSLPSEKQFAPQARKAPGFEFDERGAAIAREPPARSC